MRKSNMITINNTNITYSSSGLFLQQQRWIHPRRIIDSYEIIFMCQGTAYICEDGNEYILNKGDFLILEPNKEHFGYKFSEETVSFYWVHFYLSDADFISSVKNGQIASPHQLNSLFAQILHAANTYGYNLYVLDLFVASIIEEMKYQISNKSTATPLLASRIKEWIRINTAENITVKKVAEYFGYNENYIAKVFKKSYNIGIKVYINNMKVEYAKTQLSTTLFSIKEISSTLNFPTENAFVKYFKYHTNMTPSEYRNIYINTHMNKK